MSPVFIGRKRGDTFSQQVLGGHLHAQGNQRSLLSLPPQPTLLDAKSLIWSDLYLDYLHLFLLEFLLMCMMKDSRVFAKGWRTEQEHHTAPAWAKAEGLPVEYWLLCLAVPWKSELCKSPPPHLPFTYIHISPAIMTLLLDSPSHQWRPMNKGKWDVNLEAPVPLGESSLLLDLCSSEMRLLERPETLANCSPISKSGSPRAELNSL